MQRNRFTQTTTLGYRLAHEAERLRQNARTVPIGKERESLLRKARQLETARTSTNGYRLRACKRRSEMCPRQGLLKHASIRCRTLTPAERYDD